MVSDEKKAPAEPQAEIKVSMPVPLMAKVIGLVLGGSSLMGAWTNRELPSKLDGVTTKVEALTKSVESAAATLATAQATQTYQAEQIRDLRRELALIRRQMDEHDQVRSNRR